MSYNGTKIECFLMRIRTQWKESHEVMGASLHFFFFLMARKHEQNQLLFVVHTYHTLYAQVMWLINTKQQHRMSQVMANVRLMEALFGWCGKLCIHESKLSQSKMEKDLFNKLRHKACLLQQWPVVFICRYLCSSSQCGCMNIGWQMWFCACI